MRINITILLLVLFTVGVSAQSDRQYIRSGNRFYRQKDYSKAEAEYRKSLELNSNNPQAIYNLGCALMMQQKYQDAMKQYRIAADLENSKLRKARIYHNAGVIFQGGQQYDDAIEAYKESLRNNPKDNETRYNLALCQKLRKQNKQDNNKKQQENNDQDNNKEKNQDKKKDNQQQNPKEGMSKDNAEQLLKAAMQAEKETKQRVDDAAKHQKSRKLNKNW